MKIIIQFIRAISIITISTSCITPERKIEKAKKNEIKANRELNESIADNLAEIETYKKFANTKIAENKKNAEEFKLRIQNDKKKAKTKYTKEIEKLEEKNSDLKMKIDNYKAKSKEQWEIFKTEFNHEMNKLKKKYQNLTNK